MTTHLTLGHSPDPDDAFMFYALAKDLIDQRGYSFEHILQDIETLNRRAMKGELDITAISVHAYASVLDKYALLPSGSSMGDGYGPMVVTNRDISLDDLANYKISVPGTMTTAFLALSLCIGKFEYEVVPFDQIFEHVESGKSDAGLIIHEGQLTWSQRGLNLVVDLGVWWQEETGLPLPLGANTIRKDFGKKTMEEVSDLLTESIQYSLDHREEAVQYALSWARDMEVDLADKFVGMYVNHWTLDYGERGREAIRTLLRKGYEKGLIPNPVELEFVGG
ncbi:MAG: ABC transporter substrate-binding protein [Candidatus Omnitrophica bacterium]|nr:ABC transporter substrate-binding protein [Candidatus Omnitrophota bacterium]MCA9442422.1 ABC transporter substrate-binding protein [Candidatus Omnitrophota bacterium]MCB9769308.1 ABC transporter substrate-binding protein [Candidatus Omnitrophota bacterium]MCB9783912.1 ABC transporter substrate-binding protein [Candidatus Omnitrophota bacterium]